MLMARRNVMASTSGWNDPDVFDDTTLWIDLRNKEMPYTLNFQLYTRKAGTKVDWGDGTKEDSFYASVGTRRSTHTYNEARIYKITISGDHRSYHLGNYNSWSNLIGESENSAFIPKPWQSLICRARLGTSWAGGIMSNSGSPERYNVIGILYYGADSIKICSDGYDQICAAVRCHGKKFKVVSRHNFGLLSSYYPTYQKDGTEIFDFDGRILDTTTSSQMLDGETNLKFMRLVGECDLVPFVAARRTSLKGVVLGENITTIADRALSGLYGGGIKRLVSMASTPPSADGLEADSVAEDGIIYVPNRSVDAYKNAQGWLSHASKIVGVEDFTDAIKEAEIAGGVDWNLPEWPE